MFIEDSTLAREHLSPLKVVNGPQVSNGQESNLVSRALLLTVVRLHPWGIPWGSLPSGLLRNQVVCSAVSLPLLVAVIVLHFRTRRGIQAIHNFPMFYSSEQ